MRAKRRRMRLQPLWRRIGQMARAVNQNKSKAISGAFADVEKFAAFCSGLSATPIQNPHEKNEESGYEEDQDDDGSQAGQEVASK